MLAGLFLGMVIAFVLGLGLPTTPTYIIQATTVIPALIKLGLPIHVAHLFAFYYACLALITPPDASAAYTAASIAGSPPLNASARINSVLSSEWSMRMSLAHSPSDVRCAVGVRYPNCCRTSIFSWKRCQRLVRRAWIDLRWRCCSCRSLDARG